MICPFRLDIDYDVKQMGQAVVVTSKKERYPECYKENCPYYWNFGDATCRLVEKCLEEGE